MDETKVIYYVDDETTPYLLKMPMSPTKVTLGDFKNHLNKVYKKFFFKSMDDDIGVVKEEITEDDTQLPNANGRVVCWVVSEGSLSGSDVASKADLESLRGKDEDNKSIMSEMSGRPHRVSVGSSGRRKHSHQHHRSRHHHHKHGSSRGSSSGKSDMDTATELTSATDYDTTSFCDTEDTASRFSVETTSTITSLKPRKKVYTKKRVPRSMSMSTMTTSTMSDAMSDGSMQLLTVTLNMDTYSFLGISIVGQTNEDGIGGIYVGTIMKGGAVAADGRIEPGDMLLQVNDISFENMTNDDAVRTLREIVQQPGPITLTVAKCLEQEPYVPAFEPRMEPIRPLDPTAWVMQTNAQRVEYGRPFTGSPTLSTMTSNSSPSLSSSIPESERDLVKLQVTTPMYLIVKAMVAKESGLEVKDRTWLKMTIPNSFIGSDLVEWLNNKVEGFLDRRHARKYAALMLKHGFIRHTVNKITFSEQCYYVFGDMKNVSRSHAIDLSQLHHGSNDSGGDTDTLGPLPGNYYGGHGWSSSDDQLSLPPYEGQSHFHPNPIPLGSSRGAPSIFTNKSGSRSPDRRQSGPDTGHESGSSADSSVSGSTHSSTHRSQPEHAGNGNNNNGVARPRMKHSSSLSSGSEFSSISHQHLRPPGGDRRSVRSLRGATIAGASGLGGMPEDMSASRQSFQQALDNPCEYFIDVM